MWNPFKRKAKCTFKELRDYVYFEYHYRIAIAEKHDYMNISAKYISRLDAITSKYNVEVSTPFEQWEELRELIGKNIPEILE